MTQLDRELPEGYKMTELGPLPWEWEVIEFKKCVNKGRIKVGKVKQQEYKTYGKYPIIDQGQNLIAGYWDDEKDVYQGKLPVIIFGDHTRIIKYVNFPFVAGADGAKVLSPNTLVVFPKFFYYTLLNLKIPSRGYNRHYSLLSESKIPLPPLPDQRKIAAILSAVQEAKEKTEAVISAAKSLKKSMMSYLFTYGPVPLSDAENIPQKETEIGPLPEEWEVVNFSEIGKFQYGYTESGSTIKIGPKFLRITDIDLTSGNINWPSVPYCKISDVDYPKYELYDGDVLVARIGATTGKTCIIKNPPKSVFASYLIRFIHDKEKVDPFFVYYFTNSKKYWAQVNASKEGKLKKGVSSSQLKIFRAPLPPLPTQQKIASMLSAIDEKIEAEENKKKALEDLFNTLLHNLRTARIRVNHLALDKAELAM